jgi:hypothetical protein
VAPRPLALLVRLWRCIPMHDCVCKFWNCVWGLLALTYMLCVCVLCVCRPVPRLSPSQMMVSGAMMAQMGPGMMPMMPPAQYAAMVQQGFMPGMMPAVRQHSSTHAPAGAALGGIV